MSVCVCVRERVSVIECVCVLHSSSQTRVALDRSQLKAICADSFITSPSCPVSVSSPLPGILLASMNIISPPIPVHASPAVQ